MGKARVSFKINRPGVACDSSAAKMASAGGKPLRSTRRRVLLKGSFQVLTSTHQVSVRNLSCTGASIECATTLRPGADGVLQAGGLDCLCRVIWRRGNVYGVKFDQPLHNQVVLDLHRITLADLQRVERVAAQDWFNHQAR